MGIAHKIPSRVIC